MQFNLFALGFLIIGFCYSSDVHHNIIIITRNGCSFSEAMRTLCQSKNLGCVDLNEDVLQANIREITRYPNSTYPAVFMDGHFIGGYTEVARLFSSW